MKWALLVNGVAAGFDTVDPAGRYPADMQWQECPDDTVFRARFDGQFFDAGPKVPVPTTRVVDGARFLALWTPDEVAAGIASDPRLLVGAFTALAQNSVNLESTTTAGLLDLAVSKGVLTEARAAQILANDLPGSDAV